MNKWLTSVAFLLGMGVSASEAQFYQRPITNPTVRPGTGPVFNPYLGGGYNPYLGGMNTPYLGGNYYGPILGNPGAMQPGINTTTGMGPGGAVLNPTGVIAGAAVVGTGADTSMSSNITGHPTGFNAYSQYFNNQGGAFNTNVVATTGTQLNTPGGTANRRATAIGARPPQGRINFTQP
jgi:hypothetical protein